MLTKHCIHILLLKSYIVTLPVTVLDNSYYVTIKKIYVTMFS